MNSNAAWNAARYKKNEASGAMLDQTRGEQHKIDRVTLQVVQTLADFDALEAKWRKLHDACGDVSVFVSFEWLRAWWRHHAETNPWARLHLLVLEHEGLTFAIAPFYVHTFRPLRLCKLRQLRLLGHIVSDYTDILILPGFEDAACTAIQAHLRAETGFDTMSFLGVPEHSVLRTHIAENLWRAGWIGHAVVDERCPRTRLAGTWERTLETFPDSQRKRIPSLDRKLRKNYRVNVRRLQPGDDPAAALDEFMDMHQRRWVRTGERGAFATQRARDFHQDVARRFHERGWLVLSFLEADGRPVTSNYSFKSGGRLQFYLSGANDDEAVRKFAPGILLHVYDMQMMIQDGGHTYDFLRGTERYKYDLGAEDMRTFRFGVVRNTLWIRTLNKFQRVRNKIGGRLKQYQTAARVRRAAAAAKK